MHWDVSSKNLVWLCLLKDIPTNKHTISYIHIALYETSPQLMKQKYFESI